MTLVSVMVGAVVILADIALRSLIWSGPRLRTSRRERAGGEAALLILALVLAILAPIAARLVWLAVSRRREYLADASAAVFTRYPDGLASALEKISRWQGEPAQRYSAALTPLFIAPPTRALRAASGLFSTHPPIEKRIAILRSIGGVVSFSAYQQAYQKVLREKPLYHRITQDRPQKKRQPSEEDVPAQARARQATDLLWQLNGYRFLDCQCGLRFKVPEKGRKEFNCPRCRRKVTA